MPYTLRNQRVSIPSSGKVFGTGWLPPMYDPRDYTDDHKEKTGTFVQKVLNN